MLPKVYTSNLSTLGQINSQSSKLAVGKLTMRLDNRQIFKIWTLLMLLVYSDSLTNLTAEMWTLIR
jgi:hypothetical protein